MQSGVIQLQKMAQSRQTGELSEYDEDPGHKHHLHRCWERGQGCYHMTEHQKRRRRGHECQMSLWDGTPVVVALGSRTLLKG